MAIEALEIFTAFATVTLLHLSAHLTIAWPDKLPGSQMALKTTARSIVWRKKFEQRELT